MSSSPTRRVTSTSGEAPGSSSMPVSPTSRSTSRSVPSASRRVATYHAVPEPTFVAALLDDEATVKTFRKENGHVWLMPHNPAYSPIDGTHATIMGKVVTVLRKL